MTGFWNRLFGRKAPVAQPRVHDPERVATIVAKLKAAARPCLRLVPGGDGRSHLGGAPRMRAEWPRFKGRPLSLVAQLDLADMRTAGGPDWLPDQGRLLFFYELESGTWGIDTKDAGSAVVIHETGDADQAAEPADLDGDFRFDAYPVGFVADQSIPSDERLDIDWKALSPTEEGELETAVEAMQPAGPCHQVDGYPGPIQWDAMEAECENISPRGESRSDPTSVEDWRLLLQVDTDEDAGMMWCDVGRLFYWIREQDARAGDFSKIWLILQSH